MIMGPIRVLIVDDEEIAREGVRVLAESEPDIVVVGECGDGATAVDLLLRTDVDVLLLDIHMPGMDGFDVLRAVPEGRRPVVIFLTAYDQHALKAFEAHALDYVVKPFVDERFKRAVGRAREQVRQRRLGRVTNQLVALLANTTDAYAAFAATDVPSRRFLARIPVRSVGKTTYVKVEEIAWIGASDYYAELHLTSGRNVLVRETMQSLEDRLDPARFIRVHRSAIVCLDYVTETRTDSDERNFVVLRDGTRIALGRSRKDALERALAQR